MIVVVETDVIAVVQLHNWQQSPSDFDPLADDRELFAVHIVGVRDDLDNRASFVPYHVPIRVVPYSVGDSYQAYLDNLHREVVVHHMTAVPVRGNLDIPVKADTPVGYHNQAAFQAVVVHIRRTG